MQKRNNFLISALLSFSGGLQDAYTYNVRDQVFANAQTGNFVLMTQNLMSGKYAAALRFLIPICAFALGIFITEQIISRCKNAQRIVIFSEMLVLFAAGGVPAALNPLANAMVSFSCAMQLQAFREVCGFPYASTMCIGNLRTVMENLSKYLRTREKTALKNAVCVGGIILVFAIGAGLGGVLSVKWGIPTIWLSTGILLLPLLLAKNS
jgi:uncharacterized membrane protein YoaK (UPF0700 family)